MSITTHLHPDDFPGSLADANARARRNAMLAEPHVQPLAAYVVEAGRRSAGYVPQFDPMDGGNRAKLLFLFGAPGPGTFPPRGSGFVSRNNNDPSAKSCWHLMRQAEIPRTGTVSWNTVAATTSGKVASHAAAAELRHLLPLLPALRGVVLIGNFARDFGGPILKETGMKIFHTVQTGQQAQQDPDVHARWLKIPEIWRKAWDLVK